jgi:hypothetical protein
VDRAVSEPDDDRWLNAAWRVLNVCLVLVMAVLLLLTVVLTVITVDRMLLP